MRGTYEPPDDMTTGEQLLRRVDRLLSAEGTPQCDISTGTVMCWSSSRLTPPSKASRSGE